MIAFLQQLAPARPGDGSRAVALEPSRFASERPLRAVPPPAPGSDVEEEPLAEEAPRYAPGTRLVEARRRSDEQRTAETPGRAIEPGLERPIVREPDRPAAAALPPEPGDPAGTSRPAHVPVPVPVRMAVPAARTPVDRDDPIDEAYRPPPLPVEAVAPEARPHIDAPNRAVRRPARLPEPAVVRTHDSSSRPMSAEALVSRAQPTETRQPVIRVTIDRLEIRAPSPAPQARRTRQSSSQGLSLADYLRNSGRPSPGGGR